MDQAAKAKLASRLSSALHQAPEHPENFANVLVKQLTTHELHITDLRITFGDIDSYMAKQLLAAKRNAPPTYANLMDLAAPKLSLKGRTPERTLAEALGVPLGEVMERKRAGIVPRIWFDKVHELPELHETTAELSPEVKRAVEALVDDGFTPEEINQVFARIRTTRIDAKQIAALHQQNVTIGLSEIESMREKLFEDRADKAKRMDIWLMTHLKKPIAADVPLSLSKKDADRLRERYKAEIRMRKEDHSYRLVAEAAELMPRPRREIGHRGRSSGGGAGAMASVLCTVFGDQDDAANRLSQLTGLTARHALDMIKGHNNLTGDWLEFLNVVSARLQHYVGREKASLEPTRGSQIAFDLTGLGHGAPTTENTVGQASVR